MPFLEINHQKSKHLIKLLNKENSLLTQIKLHNGKIHTKTFKGILDSIELSSNTKYLKILLEGFSLNILEDSLANLKNIENFLSKTVEQNKIITIENDIFNSPTVEIEVIPENIYQPFINQCLECIRNIKELNTGNRTPEVNKMLKNVNIFEASGFMAYTNLTKIALLLKTEKPHNKIEFGSIPIFKKLLSIKDHFDKAKNKIAKLTPDCWDKIFSFLSAKETGALIKGWLKVSIDASPPSAEALETMTPPLSEDSLGGQLEYLSTLSGDVAP